MRRWRQSGLLRLLFILRAGYRFGLLDLFRLRWPHSLWLKALCSLPGQRTDQPLATRFQLALQHLGPIFVKLGQLLSVRPDLLPEDYIRALQRLQDKVAPFPTALAYQQIYASLKRPVEEIYVDFDPIPVASASIAQVHHAWLRHPANQRGQEVAVKILRPDIQSVIEQDLALFYRLAKILDRLLPDASRLHMREIVAEFDQVLHDELDLTKEAANTSQLKRHFADETQLLVPEVYFDCCGQHVMTMQWMQGTPVLSKAQLRKKHIDPITLADLAVTIFFTQVFQHGFFHADMHPGNLRISDNGRYIAFDCGIIGTLSPQDQYYLAVNFLAIAKRDYRRVATAHAACGWIPANSDITAFESAIRAVCEPIFGQPLARISFGTLLLRLFEVSRTFKINIQPQLLLLQKTLMYVESLGRELNPMLDIWAIAKPFLAQWMKKQVGWQGLLRGIRQEMPDWVNILPMMPRKLDDWLQRYHSNAAQPFLVHLLQESQKQNRRLTLVIIMLLIIGVFVFFNPIG